MGIAIALGLTVTTTAHADGKKPLPGADHQPPVFLDESVSFLRVQQDDDHYRVSAYVRVAGVANRTDRLRLEWKQHDKLLAVAKCAVDVNMDGKIAAGRCETDDKKLTARGPVDAALIYTDDQDDKDYLVRTYHLTIAQWTDKFKKPVWQVLADDTLGSAYVHMWRSDDNPGYFRQPEFMYWSSSFGYFKNGTLRCTVNGKKIPDFDTSSDRVTDSPTDQIEASFTTKAGSQIKYEWKHVGFTIRAWVGPKSDPNGIHDPSQVRYLADSPGAWICDLRSDGNVLRTFLFDVDDQGLIVQNEILSGKGAPPTLPDVRMIEVRLPKKTTYDQRVNPAAMKKTMAFGLAWPDHPKVKDIQAALPPKSGLADP
jgi:hypothetical protein